MANEIPITVAECHECGALAQYVGNQPTKCPVCGHEYCDECDTHQQGE